MTLSSNTAQTRELGELRNHLKWLDEERRKSARKMAELEQRMAQQGRDLAERDQKIQELEWHVANFAERFERIPENDPNAGAQEQRLQDLEWHLSNINTQLNGQAARIPNMEEERARLRDEVAAAVAAAQQRWQSDQSLAEGRFLSELATLRDADNRLALQYQAMEESLPAALRLEDRFVPLAQQQDAQAETLDRLDRQYIALQESVGLLTTQLRDRTVTLAAESQTHLTALAARLQERLDAMAADWQEKLNAVANRAPETSPEIVLLGERLDEVEQQTSLRIAATGQEWQQRVAQLEQRIGNLDALLAPLGTTQADLAAAVDNLPGIAAQVAELEQQLGEISEYVAPLGTRQSDLAAAIEPLPRLSVQLAELENRLDGVQALMAPLAERQATFAATVEQLPGLRAAVEELPGLRAAVEELPGLRAAVEQLPHLQAAVDQLQGLRVSVDELQGIQVAVEQLPRLDAAVQELPGIAAQVARLEEAVAKLVSVRDIVPLVTQMQQELELRQAEEVRLSNLISAQEGRFTPLNTSFEELRETNLTLLGRVSEAERLVEEVRRSSQDFNDNWKPLLTELSRRVGPLAERLSVLNNNILKAEASLEALSSDQVEMRERLANVSDDVQRGRLESGRQLDAWQTTLDEHKETIERFTQQWLTLSNQYKEARMAVQNFAHWQKQLEQQKREASEMVRVETNRMQSRWDGFLMEIQEKLKNFELELSQKWQVFELENEQKWSSARRSEQVWREELGAIDELIQKLQQDNRNLIWRVQAAQADAIKKWPRLLMEEVEKAVELNPARRSLGSASAPRADISVVDAIEQGLITLDYSDDAVDL